MAPPRDGPAAVGAKRVRGAVDEQAGEPFVDTDRRLGRVRLSHDIGHPQRDAAMDARIEVDPRARQTIVPELGFRAEPLERLALRTCMRAIDVSHEKCPS